MSENFDNRQLWPTSTRNIGKKAHISGVELSKAAQQHGTPLYIFDETTIRQLAAEFQASFADYEAGVLISYASKAYLCTAIAQLMVELGLGIDVVSAGELAIALRAGMPPERIHLHGNATPRHEFAAALHANVRHIVIDNADQLQTIIELTENRDQPQPILFRIAPDVIAGGHKHIQTGSAESKFGFDPRRADFLPTVQRALNAPTLALDGLHCHIGSQIGNMGDFGIAVRRMIEFASLLHEKFNWRMRTFCPGGGLIAPTDPQAAPSPTIAQYATTVKAALRAACRQHQLPLPSLLLEPGRALIARAGVALYTITGRKHLSDGSSYLHIDGGMGDNPRPALYRARYSAALVHRFGSPRNHSYHISGRYCESGDMLINDIRLPEAQPDDILAVPMSGAYTLNMASNYNGVGRPAVFLARPSGDLTLIQKRETTDMLMSRDLPLND